MGVSPYSNTRINRPKRARLQLTLASMKGIEIGVDAVQIDSSVRQCFSQERLFVTLLGVPMGQSGPFNRSGTGQAVAALGSCKRSKRHQRMPAEELMRLVDVAATTLLACIHNSSKSTAICCVTAGALILSITTKKFASCSIEVLLFVSYCAILRNIKYQQQSSLIMSHLPLHVPYMTIQEGDITCNPLTTCDCT